MAFSAAVGLAVTGAVAVAVACTPVPPAPQVNWSFVGLPLKAPGAGVNVGDPASLTYNVTNPSKGDEVVIQHGQHIVIQEGSKLVPTTIWITVVEPTTFLAGSASVVPPFGRSSYRVALLDPDGNVLTSTTHTIDAYRLFTLGFLTHRLLQTIHTGLGPITYYFQAEIDLSPTSCRDLTDMRMYDAGSKTRDLKITQTIGKKSSSQNFAAAGFHQVHFGPVASTPGENLDLHVVNNAALGDNLDVFGEADCFTDTGSY